MILGSKSALSHFTHALQVAQCLKLTWSSVQLRVVTPIPSCIGQGGAVQGWSELDSMLFAIFGTMDCISVKVSVSGAHNAAIVSPVSPRYQKNIYIQS